MGHLTRTYFNNGSPAVGITVGEATLEDEVVILTVANLVGGRTRRSGLTLEVATRIGEVTLARHGSYGPGTSGDVRHTASLSDIEGSTGSCRGHVQGQPDVLGGVKDGTLEVTPVACEAHAAHGVAGYDVQFALARHLVAVLGVVAVGEVPVAGLSLGHGDGMGGVLPIIPDGAVARHLDGLGLCTAGQGHTP